MVQEQVCILYEHSNLFAIANCKLICKKQGNIYDIYQQEISEIDMSTHLPRWKNFLATQIGRELEDDDFLFPYVAPNGVIHIKRDMSYAALQVLLVKFSDGAGVTKHYTTHCFQRGGAQYRFMFAPIGMQWSLSRIRWWVVGQSENMYGI